jgi:hypothetical protein
MDTDGEGQRREPGLVKHRERSLCFTFHEVREQRTIERVLR